MATTFDNTIRGIHVSPGIYTKETELNYAVKSLGITTLGVAGETLRGPAFEPISVSNWREYQQIFGGTSTEKFKGTQYPKYELPYIAKSYLSESEQLSVVRVLGLSGYNAGPAWAIKANNGNVIAIIRSRGTYFGYNGISNTAVDGNNDDCDCLTKRFDSVTYFVGETNQSDCSNPKVYWDALKLQPYDPIDNAGNCASTDIGQNTGEWGVNVYDYGRFRICGVSGKGETTWTNANVKNTVAGYFEYAVSLNPQDKDYILKVIGSSTTDGDSPIYCESLYDVALKQGIERNEITAISENMQFYPAFMIADYCNIAPVDEVLKDFNTQSHLNLDRRHVGMRFLGHHYEKKIYTMPFDVETGKPAKFGTYSVYEVYNAQEVSLDGELVKDGDGNPVMKDYVRFVKYEGLPQDCVHGGIIYTVKQYKDDNGKRQYAYGFDVKNVTEDNGACFVNNGTTSYTGSYDERPTVGQRGQTAITHTGHKIDYDPGDTQFDSQNLASDKLTWSETGKSNDEGLVKCLADGLYYRVDVEPANDYSNTTAIPVCCDLNNYRSAYRYASTPWFVSNVKGDANYINVDRLFRLHTISDGDGCNREIKVSIENVLPDTGQFDVVIRYIFDTDASPVVLERFQKCNMVPGNDHYVAFMIGSFDGTYEVKSKYVTVEVNETLPAQNSVPCGFLGYPNPHYTGNQIVDSSKAENIFYPELQYNLTFYDDIKNRKQYFGLSDLEGVDIDAFTYKGDVAYIDDPEHYGFGFHLDSRMDEANYNSDVNTKIIVDNDINSVGKYHFHAVAASNRSAILTYAPIIGTEEEMYGSIYEYVNLRKFTAYFYGGFDGWDVYRDRRTNTDEYKMTRYKGFVAKQSGEGYGFSKILNPELIGLDQQGITSDWYAYLAGIRQFANPENQDINILATPGIDYVNNNLLVKEVIEMVETERADSIYVVTTPDKPAGAGESITEIYTAEDAADNRLDSEIDSKYTCTYYPWVKYFDQDNSQYIYLPATKDIVRDMAQTDNQAQPWFAPAGINRGDVVCERARYITKLADEDVLYDNGINPVKTFAVDGVKLWGQKVMTENGDAILSRIAVRRLMLRLRKLISIACLQLIFEPNDEAVRQQFTSIVNPILENMKANRGLMDYRLEVDSSLESMEKRELNARLFLKAFNALEWINLEFRVTPLGLSFDDV